MTVQVAKVAEFISDVKMITATYKMEVHMAIIRKKIKFDKTGRQTVFELNDSIP